MPRYYLKALGGASKVGTLVGLAPVNHGTTLEDIVTVARSSGSTRPPFLCLTAKAVIS